jgi:glyoxylase-like metal-dependent hydrolase (beta-lactamase superfamily II)
MSIGRRPILLTLGMLMTVGLAACSTPPTMRRVVQDAAAAMGGVEQLAAIDTLTMSGGTGTRTRLGQTMHVDDAETAGQLTEVVEIADLAGGRASLDYLIDNGGFMQHRHEVLTRNGEGADAPLIGIEIIPGRPTTAMSASGLFSWGTQNSPEFLLRRNVVSIMLAAVASATDEAPQDKELDGRTYLYGMAQTGGGEEIGLYFDPESKLLATYEVTDTETMLGDVSALYLLGDYRAVGDVMLPHRITIRKDSRPYSEVQFPSMAVNDPVAREAFAIPADVAAEADRAVLPDDYSPVTLSEVAPGVFLASAYSHNSLVVEFPTFIAVVEAPYTEAQSITLARVIGEQFPGKPIRYAAVTHHHYDHTGGVRGIAAQGATVLVERGHEAAMVRLLGAPHTRPPDELATRRADGQPTGAIEVYEGKKVISEGPQSLELYAITGSPHVEPMVIAYVPRGSVLFQSDLFFPGTGGGGPAAEHLLQSVRALGLRVDTNVGGHGGVAPFAELVKAAGAN